MLVWLQSCQCWAGALWGILVSRSVRPAQPSQLQLSIRGRNSSPPVLALLALLASHGQLQPWLVWGIYCSTTRHWEVERERDQLIVIINHYTSTESVQTSHVPAKLMDQTISLSTDKKDIKTVKLVLVKIVASLLSTISGLLSWHESNFLPNCSRYESLKFPKNHHLTGNTPGQVSSRFKLF